jgi:hypothetical protein
MAQPTVTARPATWTGTNMPILYKLTSTNYAQAGYRFVVEVWNAGTAAKIADAVYYTDPSGNLVVNIGAFLKAAINLEVTHAINTEGLLEDTNYIEYYIKYQEIWTASSESQVNDSGNTRLALYGGIQLPASANSLADYVVTDSSTTSKWLTKLTSPVMWRGWPFAIDVLTDNIADTIVIEAESDSEAAQNIGTDLDPKQITSVVLTGSDFDNETDKEFTLKAYNDTETADASKTITIRLRDACANPIMLMGRNSLGGLIFWLFDVTQDYTFSYENGRKAKRLVLTALNLSINEWEAIEDFVSLGEVYRNNITEVTSSTIKTKSVIGQQVYAVNSDGTKLGVIVIPNQNQTRTKQVTHSFTLEVEYPEVL